MDFVFLLSALSFGVPFKEKVRVEIGANIAFEGRSRCAVYLSPILVRGRTLAPQALIRRWLDLMFHGGNG